MLKTYKINNYSQILKIRKDKIMDVICTCRWSTLHANHYKEGKQVCKHIKECLKQFLNQNEK